jgi:hypothetical protein
VFTVANLLATLVRRRAVLLLASVVVALVLGKFGVGNLHLGVWDGPAGH